MKTRQLDYDFSPATRASDVATVAVLLHGRGSDKNDLQGLRAALPADWALVTPRAPFPGAPWGYGGGYAWYRYIEEDRVHTDTLDETLGLLDDFLGSLESVIGARPGRIVLGGFSQGGTSSLAYALTRPGTIHTVLNFSGFLAASITVDETGGTPPPGTRIFWAHGTGDPSIPFALAEKGRNRLRRARVKLVTRDYRIGHWIVPEEVADAVAAVDAAE
jgi:phospholipase/carboxylesterase